MDYMERFITTVAMVAIGVGVYDLLKMLLGALSEWIIKHTDVD